MQELKIFRWCDHCHEDGGAMVEAIERYVAVIDLPSGRPQAPRTLDLCDTHAKPVRELRELLIRKGALIPKGEGPLTAMGLKPAKPEAKPEPDPDPAEIKEGDKSRACPLCAKRMTRASILAHLADVHGCRRVTQPKKCPDCGKRFDLSRLMVVHRGLMHGYDYWAEVAATAKRRR